jgi:Tubulin-tyrosine ligase family
VLDTFIAANVAEVVRWAQARWSRVSSMESESVAETSTVKPPATPTPPTPPPPTASSPSSSSLIECNSTLAGESDIFDDSDWWAIKASRGNGGKDVWFMNKRNYTQVTAELPRGDELVIQKYVPRPLLWNGKKFHFRCYAFMTADMSAYVYQKAFILSAGFDYDCSDEDSRRHITNLSVNKGLPNHPGQVPCSLKEEYPAIFTKICTLWSDLVRVAGDFMTEQTSDHRFEFFGVDIIADEDGNAWLIEVNRLPGLESSKNNKVIEDVFYDTMMLELLNLVLQPLEGIDPASGGFKASTTTSCADSVEKGTHQVSPVLWDQVKDGDRSSTAGGGGVTLVDRGTPATWKNTFSWKAYTRKERQNVLIKCLIPTL